MFDFLKRARSPIQIVRLNDVYHSYRGAITGRNVAPAKKLGKAGGKLFVLSFRGDVMATQASALSEEITAVLSGANPATDEVMIRVESPGGAVHAYGYASSQINRLKAAKIPVTICVDKIAASGGYMMACLGDQILAAPYAVLGSIGVVAEFMNFNSLLKQMGISYQQYTAGKYKRTVGPLGPITEEGETKFNNDLQRVHVLFKEHVQRFRADVNIDDIATGEHWYGIDAKEKGLVDHIATSEDYILHAISQREVLSVRYAPPRNFGDRIRLSLAKLCTDVFLEITGVYMRMRI
tara:strand:- start:1103 stop:1984 length:882 start_codon:yes stop_codon:yes gene_type:complete